MTRARTTLLILTFSEIVSDARILKQVEYFSGRYEVTTCGYGPAPDGVARHIRIPDGTHNALYGRLITLKAYRSAYWRQDGVRAARELLAGERFDVILANDADTVPLALALQPRNGVHADLHEYFPRWREDDANWLRRIGPYYSWLCRRYVTRAASASTVSGGLAREYERQFGVPVQVVTNATPETELRPVPVGSPVRLVHSGAATRRRHLEILIEAAAAFPERVELDLFLIKNDPAYFVELESAAARTSNVRVHGPIPYRDLLTRLNGYDIGIFVVPPVTFNLRWTLPNKFFDFVQARLGVIVGPSPEMAELVDEHGLGAVTEGFAVDDVVRVLEALDGERVADWKAASDRAAGVLGAEPQVARWGAAIAAIAGA